MKKYFQQFNKNAKKLNRKEIIPGNKKISEILEQFSDNIESNKISFNDIKAALGERSFALLIIIFTLPNFIPAPGISAIFGLSIIFISIQLLIGRKEPWFPKFVVDRKINRKDFKKIINYCLPYIKKSENLIRPRFLNLTSIKMERFIAFWILALASILTLPIPFCNWLPAFTILLLAIAILERDGLLVIFGFISTVISFIVTFLVVGTAFHATILAIEKIFNFAF